MRFTPTGTYLSYAKGSAKVLRWKIYIRPVYSMGLSLSSSGWIDVTGYIYADGIPSFGSQIEYEIGQFTADSVDFSAKDVRWWRSNIFTDDVMAESKIFLEIKVEFQLGISSSVFASDLAPVYCGFIDKVGVKYNEKRDSIDFTCFTAEDIGSRTPGELVTTQFINTNVDGAGTKALISQGIVGLYITSANNGGKPLSVGVHTISFQISGANKQIKLDNGPFLTLANGFNVIGDVDNASLDTQKLQVYVISTASLPSAGVFSDQIVVTTKGVVLPGQWFRNSQALFLLKQLYAQIGISSVNFDTMELNAWDGGARITNFEIPPNDVGITGTKNAMTTDGTYLYIAIGNNIYKKDPFTGVYSLAVNVPGTGGTPIINRLWYNARNNHLWMSYTYASGHSYECVRRFDLATSFLTGETPLTADTTALSSYVSTELLDVNYTGSLWKYGIVYANNEAGFADLYFVDGLTFSKSAIGTGLAPSTTWPFRDYILKYATASPNNIALWYRAVNGGNDDLRELTVNTSGNFVDVGFKITAGQGRIAYNPILDRIVQANVGAIVSFPSGSYSPFTHRTGSTADSLLYANGRVYFTSSGSPDSVGYIDGAASPASIMALGPCDTTKYNVAFCGKLFGITITTGMLWQADAGLPFRVPLADFGGISVRDGINKILKAFNLTAVISGNKTANVYRRGDVLGVPKTSGNILSISISDVEDVDMENATYQSFDLVKITGQSSSVSFNGSGFNESVLSDKVVLEINNSFIPDVMVKDVAYYVYQFFKLNRSLVSVRLSHQPLFQYEVYDGVSVNFPSSMKNPIAASGASNPIYLIRYTRDGSLELQFLISQPTKVVADSDIWALLDRLFAESWQSEGRYQLVERRRERFPR